jgi:hypothetical protein
LAERGHEREADGIGSPTCLTVTDSRFLSRRQATCRPRDWGGASFEMTGSLVAILPGGCEIRFGFGGEPPRDVGVLAVERDVLEKELDGRLAEQGPMHAEPQWRSMAFAIS